MKTLRFLFLFSLISTFAFNLTAQELSNQEIIKNSIKAIKNVENLAYRIEQKHKHLSHRDSVLINK